MPPAHRARPALHALLIDLDGVLRDWSEALSSLAVLEQDLHLAAGAVHAIAFRSDLLAPAVLGEMPDEQWRLAVARELMQQIGAEQAIELVSAWSEPAGDIQPEVLAVVRAVRARGVPVALVTNATSRLEFDLVRLGLHQELDVVTSSCRIAVAKPDAGIYLAAAGALDMAPQQCLFVDDSSTFVAGAERLGMTGVLYTGPSSLTQVAAELMPAA